MAIGGTVTMPFSTPEEVRLFFNQDPKVAGDAKLKFMIEQGDKRIVNALSGKVFDEKPDGIFDGTNATFQTKKFPIADKDADFTVATTEITVWGWLKLGDESSRTSLAVKSLSNLIGLFELVIAPNPTIYVRISVDYFYYTFQPDQTLFKLLSMKMAFYAFMMSEFLMVPVNQSLGGYRMRHDHPYKHLWLDILNTFSEIRTKPFRASRLEGTSSTDLLPLSDQGG